MNLKVSQALKRNVLPSVRRPENVCKTSSRHRFLPTIVDADDAEERWQYSAIFRKLDKEPVSAVPISLTIVIEWKTLLINDLMTLQCEPATSSIFNRYLHCASE
jgi:hypothetical protein